MTGAGSATVGGRATPIAFRETGRGPNLLLIHGVAADAESFRLMAPKLENDFRLVTVERRGRGRSEDVEPYGIEQEFDDIADLVDALDRPAILFGHSFGGSIALGAALRSRNVIGVVAYEPGHPGDGSEQLAQEFERLLSLGDRRGMFRLALRTFADFPQKHVDELLDLPVWQERLAYAHTIPRELRAYGDCGHGELSQLRVPVLLLVGSESAQGLRMGAIALERTLPNVRLTVVEGHGHVANITAPEVLAREIRLFAGLPGEVTTTQHSLSARP